MLALISSCDLDDKIIHSGVETFRYIKSEDYGKIKDCLGISTGCASYGEVIGRFSVCPGHHTIS